MTVPMHNRLEAALVELREQQQKIKAFDETRKAQRTTLLSKNRMVSVTVDSSGLLVDLAFKGTRYRSLPPAELAALVRETVTRAQHTAREEVEATASGLMPADPLGLGEVFGPNMDIDAMFDAAMRLAEQPIFADERPPSTEEATKP